jgi:hypothetical protein
MRQHEELRRQLRRFPRQKGQVSFAMAGTGKRITDSRGRAALYVGRKGVSGGLMPEARRKAGGIGKKMKSKNNLCLESLCGMMIATIWKPEFT